MTVKRRKLLFLVTVDWAFCLHRLLLARAAKDAGFDVIVVTQEVNHGKEIRAEGFRLIPIVFTRSLGKPWQEMMTLFTIWKIYRQELPEIVHQVALKPIIYGSFVSLVTGRHTFRIVNALTGLGFLFISTNPLIVFLRGIVKTFMRLVFSRKHVHVIVQNQDDLRMLIDEHIIRREQISLIRGSGVDINLFKPSTEPAADLTIMLVARMLKDKGIEEFVESAAKIRKEGISARFVLVGDTDPGNPSSIMESRLQQWHADGAVEWWGRHNDMVAVYQQAHIVVLPTYREGLPRTLLEAASCGLPIVATDVPGCREIVLPDINGILVPARDVDALAAAIKRLIENADLRREMGRQGRLLVEAEFSSTRVIKETLDLYRHLLRD